jgi:hypothetical protein
MARRGTTVRVRQKSLQKPRKQGLTDSHGIPAEEAADVPITGTPTQAAERFAAYADARATWLVLIAIGGDWHAQWELIAEAATLLD